MRVTRNKRICSFKSSQTMVLGLFKLRQHKYIGNVYKYSRRKVCLFIVEFFNKGVF